MSMAWRCSGATNRELVENLWNTGLIKDPRVKDAFLKVDRAHYAPHSPYEDSPQSIGHSATISAPHMHAEAVAGLLPYVLPAAAASPEGTAQRRNRRVLDIGSGSGYLTHVLAELACGSDGDGGGTVVGLEHIAALRDLGEANMRRSAEGRRLLDSGRVRFRVGDGRRGWREPDEGGADNDPASSGWDAIHVGASAAELHQELIDQLRSPGRMFIPVDDDSLGWMQHIWVVDKDEQGRVTKSKGLGVQYVPLTDAPR